MKMCIHILAEYMKPQSIICEGTDETKKKLQEIGRKALNVTETQENKKGKLHFALRPTKRVTLILHVNNFPFPLSPEICNQQLFSLKKLKILCSL